MKIINSIQNWFGGAKNATQNTANYANKQANAAWDNTQSAANNATDSIRNQASGTWDNAQSAINSATSNTGKQANQAWNKAGSAISGTAGAAANATNSIANKGAEMVGNASDEGKTAAGNISNQANETWQNASSSVSNMGIQSQNSGVWWKKALPLLLILAVGFWAVSYFTGTNPLSGLWGKTENSMQTLEASVDGAMESTSNAAGTAMGSVKGAFSTFSLPNGENIEFTKGSFGENLTTWLASDEIEEGKVFTFDNLNFATGSADLAEESKVQLNNLAQVLNAYPSVQIRIEGHTDNTGNAAANKLLSQQRAESAKEYLVTSANLDATRIATQGWGSEKAVARNDTPEDRLKNRRTDLVITQK